MADHSKIEWTDATWTPVKGCTRVSPGCGGPGKAGGCYAEIMAARFSQPGQWGEGLAEIVTLPDGSKDHRWTGVVRFDEAELIKPLRWKKPRKIFVCSTADLFHEKVEDAWIDQVFAIMALCPQHTFQVLTKRPERMRAWFARYDAAHDHNCADFVADQMAILLGVPGARGAARTGDHDWDWPLRNVWLGTSAEDQQRADERIPHQLATPAAARFVSAEPLLGPIDLSSIPWDVAGYGMAGALPTPDEPDDFRYWHHRTQGLSWVIAGGESGPGARGMHPDWAGLLRDQCAAAGVPFFFKQWGEWAPHPGGVDYKHLHQWVSPDGRFPEGPGSPSEFGGALMLRLGKKAAGRLLDGQLHDGMPPHA